MDTQKHETTCPQIKWGSAVGILSTQAADAEKRAAHAEKTTEEERAARVKLEAEVESERLSRKPQ